MTHEHDSGKEIEVTVKLTGDELEKLRHLTQMCIDLPQVAACRIGEHSLKIYVTAKNLCWPDIVTPKSSLYDKLNDAYYAEAIKIKDIKHG